MNELSDNADIAELRYGTSNYLIAKVNITCLEKLILKSVMPRDKQNGNDCTSKQRDKSCINITRTELQLSIK